MIRHSEFDEKVAGPDHLDPDLAVLITKLNESFAVIDTVEDAAVNGCREVLRSGAEGRVATDRQEASHKYQRILRLADSNFEESAVQGRQDLPEELEELERSFQYALFPGLDRPANDQESPNTGLPRTGKSEGRTSRVNLTGMASLAVLVILGAVWFGSRIDMKIGDLNETVAHLERQVLEGRASIQTTEHQLGNLTQVHEENGYSIQKIERVVESLRLSTTADIEMLSEQIGALQDADAVSDASPAPAAPTPVPVPTATWGVNLTSFATQDKAMREMERMHSAGIEVVVRVAHVEDKRWYRLRVEGFSNREAARSFIRQYRSRPEFAGAWISHEL